ncbi:GAF domain-containing protein [Streptomyces sp. NPDC059373]
MTVFDSESSLYVPSADAGREQRIKVLGELGLGGPDPQFDAFAADLAREAGLPYGMVNLFKDRQVFAGLYCSPEGDFPEVDRTMPLDHGYCPATIEREAPLVLPDVLDSPRFASNPVVDKIGIRTYAGAKLVHEPTGTVLGTVCVVGTVELPRETGQPMLALIKARRDALMELIYQRTGHVPQ